MHNQGMNSSAVVRKEKTMDDLISRQTAIKAADSIIERDTSGNNDVVKAMTAWKKYIKALPSAQPDHIGEVTEMVGDAVSRQGVLRLLNAVPSEEFATKAMLIGGVNALPSAQPDIPDMNVIIDTIKNAISASTGNDAYMVGLRNGMRWCLSALTDKEPEYEDMPPAQPGWIPVTEKCPEIGQIVLCSLKTRHYYGRIHVCKYRAADKYYDHSYFDWDHNGFPDVVAWMPLPTPYREGGQE